MSRRHSFRSARRVGRGWWLAAAVIAGSAVTAAYLLDRERGLLRRRQIRQHAVHLARRSVRGPARVASGAGSASAAEERWPEEPPPDVDSEVDNGSGVVASTPRE